MSDGNAPVLAATDRVRDANKTTRDDVDQLASQVSIIHRRLIQLGERVDRQGGAGNPA